MTFDVKYLDKLKDAFDCFKGASCKTCRAADDVRFKTKVKLIDETDTPKKVIIISITSPRHASRY